MDVSDIVREWFMHHGRTGNADEDINELSNVDMLMHIGMAIEERLNGQRLG